MSYIEELWELVGDRPLLLPGTGLILLDRRGQVLLQRRNDDGTWGLPGGMLEPSERLEEAARREAREELGIELGELRLFDVFAGPEHYHDYPGRGRVYGVSVVYVVEGVEGPLRTDDGEVAAVRFFPPRELPDDLEQNTKHILAAYVRRPPADG